MKNVPVISKDGPFPLISPPSTSVFAWDKLDASFYGMQINYVYILSFKHHGNSNEKHIIALFSWWGRVSLREVKLFEISECTKEGEVRGKKQHGFENHTVLGIHFWNTGALLCTAEAQVPWLPTLTGCPKSWAGTLEGTFAMCS